MEIGQTIAHYKIVRKLGHGGKGDVYEAHDTKLDRPVAIKVLKPELIGDQAYRRRFLREARSSAAIAHPYIAAVHGVDEIVRALEEADEGCVVSRGTFFVIRNSETALRTSTKYEKRSHAKAAARRPPLLGFPFALPG